MKYLVISFLFILCSCSSIHQKESLSNVEEKLIETQQQSVNFMTHEEIKEEFIRLAEAEEMDERLDQKALKRLDETVKDKLFISPDHLKELHDEIKKREEEQKFEKTEGEVDRSKCDNIAINQCGGTCTSHAITNAMDNLLCRPNIQNSSNQHLWSKYKRYSTWTGIKTAAKVKVCEDKYWPNCGKKTSKCERNSHVGLKSWKYLGNDVDAIKKALDEGHPLVYSGKVTRSWAKCDAVINPKSNPTGGGHAVAIVGYKEDADVMGGGYLKILNSWGTDCGDYGYQYIPFHYLKRTDRDMYGFAHEIKAIHSKYNNDTIEPSDPTPKPNCKKVRKCGPWKRKWYAPWKKYRKCGPWKTICK